MDEFIKGIIGFLGDNPAFLTLLVGFILGLFTGMKIR